MALDDLSNMVGVRVKRRQEVSTHQEKDDICRSQFESNGGFVVFADADISLVADPADSTGFQWRKMLT
ncbi:MAG: hypothetical protein IPK82_24580 [Polyangiaceae bacterium]|nr:hypothetical protein [Polyangiaceae bacterium]